MDWYKKIRKSEIKKSAECIICEYIKVRAVFTDVIDYDFKFVDIIHADYTDQLKENEAICGVINYPLKKIEIAITPHSNLAQLIDTIAHEIAHISYYHHGPKHTGLKMKIKKCIKEFLKFKGD
jgi:uncharacterized protein YjaZ